jgi:uncharacterized protein (TIGR03382 family)
VPRGDVTITAAGDGYAGEREVYVTADDLTWGSIAMTVDDGDDDGDDDPADPGSDAGIGDDDPDDSSMDGGCSTSGGSSAVLALIMGTGMAISRRRK